jgi:hypothetical protein
MKPAIYLQTKYGLDLYKAVKFQFDTAKSNDQLSPLKQVLFRERSSTEKSLIEFLNDDIMARQYKMDEEDADGWMFYKQTADRFSVLNYFYNRGA